MTNSTKTLYAGHRFPPELISYTVWLYFRFPLSLRTVEEMLAFRGIEVSHETIRQWGLKFGREFANIIRRRLPRPGDKWHLDLRHEVGLDSTVTLVANSLRPHAAFWSAANHEQRVWAVGMPFTQFPIRTKLMAAALMICCRCVLASPI
jgi:hypothetical protein